jgi:zinc finger MYND domain-containing protein 10
MEGVMSASDAERAVQFLRAFPVAMVGSDEWLLQHEALERMNVAAHANAQGNKDDYVLASLLTFDKLPVLVHELYSVSTFRRCLLPHIVSDGRVAASASHVRLYFCLYHEASLVNLLECLLYHDYAAESLGDAAIDLVDFCVARVEELVAGVYSAREAPAVAAGTGSGTVQEQSRRWLSDIGFSVSIASVTILRYISEHLPKLQLSVMARVLDRHDVILLQVPLIENPPWVRRVDGAKWQKWVGNVWQDVDPRDLMKISPCEGQPWREFYLVPWECGGGF